MPDTLCATAIHGVVCFSGLLSNQWTVRDFFRGVAGLGGFLGRTGDGEPGWITIWRGWEVLHWMLRGAQLAAQPSV